MINYYEILGVSENATQEEIRVAYIKKIKENHPDLTTDENEKQQKEEKSKIINEAYDVLYNLDKRKEYDENRFYQNEYNNYENDTTTDDEYTQQSWDETKEQYTKEEQEYAEVQATKLLFEKLIATKSDYVATKETILYSLIDDTVDNTEYLSMMTQFQEQLLSFIKELADCKPFLEKYSLSDELKLLDDGMEELNNLINVSDWDYFTTKKHIKEIVRGNSVIEYINAVASETDELLSSLRAIVLQFYKNEISRLQYFQEYNAVREKCCIKAKLLEDLFKKARLNKFGAARYADAEKKYKLLLSELSCVDIYKKAEISGPILQEKLKLEDLLSRLEIVKDKIENNYKRITPYDAELDDFLDDFDETEKILKEINYLYNKNNGKKNTTKSSEIEFLNELRIHLLSGKEKSDNLNKLYNFMAETAENTSKMTHDQLKTLFDKLVQDIDSINYAELVDAIIDFKNVILTGEVLINNEFNYEEQNYLAHLEKCSKKSQEVLNSYIKKIECIANQLNADMGRLGNILNCSKMASGDIKIIKRNAKVAVCSLLLALLMFSSQFLVSLSINRIVLDILSGASALLAGILGITAGIDNIQSKEFINSCLPLCSYKGKIDQGKVDEIKEQLENCKNIKTKILRNQYAKNINIY